MLLQPNHITMDKQLQQIGRSTKSDTFQGRIIEHGKALAFSCADERKRKFSWSSPILVSLDLKIPLFGV